MQTFRPSNFYKLKITVAFFPTFDQNFVIRRTHLEKCRYRESHRGSTQAASSQATADFPQNTFFYFLPVPHLPVIQTLSLST